MTAKHKCSVRIWRNIGWYPCSRSATVERDGIWYCWQHNPIRIEAKAKKRRADQQALKDRVLVNWKRNTHNARLAELVTLELPALLERLTAWTIKPSDKAYALTLAARIREALAQEASSES